MCVCGILYLTIASVMDNGRVAGWCTGYGRPWSGMRCYAVGYLTSFIQTGGSAGKLPNSGLNQQQFGVATTTDTNVNETDQRDQ